MAHIVICKTLKDAREEFRRLLLKSMHPCENSEKQKILDEIEELLWWVLEEYSENIHAVEWVFVSSKKDSELAARALHALYSLNREKPFPGL